jgi:hypothetical protein
MTHVSVGDLVPEDDSGGVHADELQGARVASASSP